MNTIISNLSQTCRSRSLNREDSFKNNRHLEVLENAFQSFSMEEQNKIQQSVYGHEDLTEEHPEFISRKMDDLEKELNNLSDYAKEAYKEAVEIELKEAAAAAAERRTVDQGNQNAADEDEQDKSQDEIDEDKNGERRAIDQGNQNADEDEQDKSRDEFDGDKNGDYRYYVSGREFRLIFLRAESYNARNAARRLARFFKVKLSLFGQGKLASRIKQEDLGEKALIALRSGGFSIPGTKDKTGRAIILSKRSRREGVKQTEMKRAAFYLFQSYLEKDEAAQKNGTVFISYNVGKQKQTSFAEQRASNLQVIKMIALDLPLRAEAVHVCYDDLREHIAMNICAIVFPTYLRARCVCHYGSHEECLANLLSFGIDGDSLPLRQDGDVNEKAILHYLQELCQKEENNSDQVDVNEHKKFQS